ncbi:hypothetical protein [Thalassotalea sp. Y01]|uniref:hypothetical protein n=1 Tax=Thalassotalea sp. Y01 TaxID=2729613 RepID=UPI00145D6890|nr:hypothetical protein [Thalassotalea sp. Y01]NMP15018.1 hypothetical protein [Thalassotalea sp. Y01]
MASLIDILAELASDATLSNTDQQGIAQLASKHGLSVAELQTLLAGDVKAIEKQQGIDSAVCINIDDPDDVPDNDDEQQERIRRAS